MTEVGKGGLMGGEKVGGEEKEGICLLQFFFVVLYVLVSLFFLLGCFCFCIFNLYINCLISRLINGSTCRYYNSFKDIRNSVTSLFELL